MSIPANQLVNVIPGVISAGGNPLAFNGVILSENLLLPAGNPSSFSTALDVADYFGATSLEAKMAEVYFTGYTNSTQIPTALLMARYPAANIGAFIVGGPGPTLAAMKAFTTGSLSITIDGTAAAISSIDLSAKTSLAAVATALTSALTPNAGGAVIAYNTMLQAFVVTSGTTGATSTVAFATGTMAGTMGLTSATGAVLSQGAVATNPADFMNALIKVTQNWVSFCTTFLPSASDMEAFSLWTDASLGRYLYAAWDNDATAEQTPSAFTGFGSWLATNQPKGTAAVFGLPSPDVTDGPLKAAFVLGITASINFGAKNGRITYAFKGNTNLTPTITDATTASNLLANGYNFYGDYATANQQFLLFNDGQVSGDYLWIDAYVDAIWLNNNLQLANMELFANMPSIPYDSDGYAMLSAAAQGPINQALNFGAIRSGIALSAAQIAQVNSQAGVDVSSQLQNSGYYYQVQPVTDPTVRGQRKSPVCTLWYTDGGSIQQITINSIDIQ